MNTKHILRKRVTLLLAFFFSSTIAMNAAQKIDRIEPTNWFVGMKNPQVQLMVYGKDVRLSLIHI